MIAARSFVAPGAAIAAMARGPVLAALLTVSTLAQSQNITTIAGGGFGDGGPAGGAYIPGPSSVATDPAGNVYVLSNRVRKIAAGTGIVTTVAGNGTPGTYGGNGVATDASFNNPQGIGVDGSGNLYVADRDNKRIWRVVLATGAISAFAGNGAHGVSGDGGPAKAATLVEPAAVAVDGAGNVWIADAGAGRMRRVDGATGIITTPTTALGAPTGLAIDGSGRVLIADTAASRVFRYDPAANTTTTIAGQNGTPGDTGDGGPATSAKLTQPHGVAVDANGNIFIATQLVNKVRRVDAVTGNISTIAGTGVSGGGGNGGPATSAQLAYPQSVAVDPSGDLLIADTGNHVVRKVSGGTISAFAGMGPDFVGDGNVATQAVLRKPSGIARDTAGNLYISEASCCSGEGGANRVRRVDAVTGIIQTVAGSFAAGGGGNGGPATSALLNSPHGLAIHPTTGELHISDRNNNAVRKVDGGGIITQVAAGFAFARGIAFDVSGNLYVADDNSGSVKKIAAGTGTVTTIATGLAGPTSVAFDAAGNLFIGDLLYVRRRDATSGVITTVAGNGVFGNPVDGVPATSAPMGRVSGLAIDAAGNLYVAEEDTSFVRRVSAATGRIATIAGSLAAAFSGDGGMATNATLSRPNSLVLDGAGSLYFADEIAGRIRKVTLAGLSSAPGTLVFTSRLPLTTSLAQRVIVSNLGSTTVNVASLTPSTGFALVANTCTAVPAGGDCYADLTYTPSAVGAINGTLAAATDAGSFAFGLAGAGELSMVAFYYESILRRTPDSPGAAFWSGERARMQNLGANVNETWFAMSSYFFASGEYAAFNRDAIGFVIDLYKTFFNRAPDAPGQQFWLDQMTNGMPREVVLASFQHSPEFASFTQGIFGNNPARAEVDMVMDFYRGLLGRLPDDAGFNAWVLQFRNAQCNPSPATGVAAAANSISEAFATSGEYTGKNRTNAQYVGDLYNAFLRRGGDLTGVNAWINALNDGTFTRKQVRDEFRKSSEFQNRVNAVAAQGCPP